MTSQSERWPFSVDRAQRRVDDRSATLPLSALSSHGIRCAHLGEHFEFVLEHVAFLDLETSRLL